MERYKYIVVEWWRLYLAIFIGCFVCSLAVFGLIMLAYGWMMGFEYAAIQTMKSWGGLYK